MRCDNYKHLYAIHVGFLFLFCKISFAADVLIPTNQITGESGSRLFVISIGTNNYRDEFWPTLKWPASDATRVSDQLGKSTQYQVVKKLLLNEYATRNNITEALLNVSTEAKPQDAVIFYVSGHGTLSQTVLGELDRVLVAHDTQQQDLSETGISHQYLYNWLNTLPARKKLMIFATCHSGEGKSRLPENVQQFVNTRKGKLVSLSEVSEGALILAAAAKGESAHENDNLQGDIYTHYLLEALNVYDRNRDGIVSAMEAHDYARDRTWAFSQGRQRPTANIKLIGDADLPLFGTKSSSGLPVLQAYDSELDGFYVQIDNGAKGRLPFAFPLNQGGSTVALYTPGGDTPIARYRVRAASGQSLTLNEVMNKRPINIGMAIRRFSKLDSDWENLSGSASSNTTELYIAYHLNRYAFGMLSNISDKEVGELRSPIKSELNVETRLFFIEYKNYFRSWLYAGRLEFGQEKMTVDLTDNSTGDRIILSDSAFSSGLSFFMGYAVAADFYLTLAGGMRDADWQFDIIGPLSGKRNWIGLGLEYRFGWVARTLW